jgi:catechol 2,3-dioxygenase-like lactoylglutathione lyase family enzyme
MDLGEFVLSLAVKDIAVSRDFYEKLGFVVIDDHQDDNWVIMENGHTKIGLFQDMFEKNTLTFHPHDVRQLQRELKEKGIKLVIETDENAAGPAYIIFTDPDGNPIMFDQLDENYKPKPPKEGSGE